MTGQSNKGKGLLAKRHAAKSKRAVILGITKPAIKRLARRGGVKRLGGDVYEAIRTELVEILDSVLHDTVAFTEHCKRNTVKTRDVVAALYRRGKPLYGFGN